MSLREPMRVLGALQKLVHSFDDDFGVPEETYKATLMFINIYMGKASELVFSGFVDSANNRFFLPSGSGKDVWCTMVDAMLQTQG